LSGTKFYTYIPAINKEEPTRLSIPNENEAGFTHKPAERDYGNEDAGSRRLLRPGGENWGGA